MSPAKEDKRVLVIAGRCSARIEDCRRFRRGRAVLVFVRVCEVRAKDDEPGFLLVGHVAAGNAGVDLREVGPRPGCLAESLDDLVGNLVVAQLPRPVVGQAGDGGLGRIPISLAVDVEIGRAVGQTPQGIAKRGDGLAWLHAAELDLAVVDAAVGCPKRRRRSHVDRSWRRGGRPNSGPRFGLSRSRAERQRIAPVHVLLDDRHPLVFQIAGQLELHDLVVDGDIRPA